MTWGVQALLVPILVSYFGREQYGLFATLSSIAGYFALFTFGSALTVPRYVAEHAARRDADGLSAFASTYFMLHVAVAAIGLLLAVALAPLLDHLLAVADWARADVRPAWGLVAGTWALGLSAGLFQSFLTGLGDVATANFVNSGRSILTLLAALAAIELRGGFLGVLVALGVAAALGSVLAFMVVRRRHPEVRVAPSLASRAVLRATLAPASLYFLMQVAALVVTGTDNLIIGSVLGVAIVAGYAIAFQMWSLAIALLWSGVDALQPFITRWDVEQEQDTLKSSYLSATRLTFLGAAIMGTLMATAGPAVARAWVGHEVAVDRDVLRVFALMLLTATPIHTAALVLAGLGRHKPAALGGAAEAVLNLALSLALVHSLGTLGVALGTLVSGAVTNAWIAPRAANRALGISFGTYVRDALLPGGVIALGGVVVAVLL